MTTVVPELCKPQSTTPQHRHREVSHRKNRKNEGGTVERERKNNVKKHQKKDNKSNKNDKLKNDTSQITTIFAHVSSIQTLPYL
jgi:hypothetical protein